MKNQKSERDLSRNSCPADAAEGRKHGKIPPAPPDSVLLSLPEAAAHLRLTVAAFRKLLETDGSPIGDQLRSMIVSLSPRRRYVKRGPFLAWLRDKCNGTTPPIDRQ
jgi:hypothetical protein